MVVVVKNSCCIRCWGISCERCVVVFSVFCFILGRLKVVFLEVMMMLELLIRLMLLFMQNLFMVVIIGIVYLQMVWNVVKQLWLVLISVVKFLVCCIFLMFILVLKLCFLVCRIIVWVLELVFVVVIVLVRLNYVFDGMVLIGGQLMVIVMMFGLGVVEVIGIVFLWVCYLSKYLFGMLVQ